MPSDRDFVSALAWLWVVLSLLILHHGAVMGSDADSTKIDTNKNGKTVRPNIFSKPRDTCPFTVTEHEKEKYKDSTTILKRSMESLGEVLDQVQLSKLLLLEKLESAMNQVAKSRDVVLKSLDIVMVESKTKVVNSYDAMMDKVTESRLKALKSFDSMVEKLTESQAKVMEGLDTVLGKMAHSKLIEELDHLLDTVAYSKVMDNIRAIPSGLRENFLLSVRNRSYLWAGVLVAISTAVLVTGCVYYSWCHHEAWAYYIGPLEQDQQTQTIEYVENKKQSANIKSKEIQVDFKTDNGLVDKQSMNGFKNIDMAINIQRESLETTLDRSEGYKINELGERIIFKNDTIKNHLSAGGDQFVKGDNGGGRGGELSLGEKCRNFESVNSGLENDLKTLNSFESNKAKERVYKENSIINSENNDLIQKVPDDIQENGGLVSSEVNEDSRDVIEKLDCFNFCDNIPSENVDSLPKDNSVNTTSQDFIETGSINSAPIL